MTVIKKVTVVECAPDIVLFTHNSYNEYTQIKCYLVFAVITNRIDEIVQFIRSKITWQ